METIFKKNSIKDLNAQELEQIASFCSDEATFLLLKETFNHIESENNAMELPAASVKQNLDDLFAQTYPKISPSVPAPMRQIPLYKQGYFRAIAAVLVVAVMTVVIKNALSDPINNTALAKMESKSVKQIKEPKKTVEQKSNIVPMASVKNLNKENDVKVKFQNPDDLVSTDFEALPNTLDDTKLVKLLSVTEDLSGFRTLDLQLSSAKDFSQTFEWTSRQDNDKFSPQSEQIKATLPDMFAVLFATY